MLKFCQSSAMIALSCAAVLAFSVPDAFAQKKLTYAQAFALCKKDVVASTPGEAASSTQRYQRGMSCMRQHGFTLKKRDTKEF
jgi:hypothetical protein